MTGLSTELLGQSKRQICAATSGAARCESWHLKIEKLVKAQTPLPWVLVAAVNRAACQDSSSLRSGPYSVEY